MFWLLPFSLPIPALHPRLFKAYIMFTETTSNLQEHLSRINRKVLPVQFVRDARFRLSTAFWLPFLSGFVTPFSPLSKKNDSIYVKEQYVRVSTFNEHVKLAEVETIRIIFPLKLPLGEDDGRNYCLIQTNLDLFRDECAIFSFTGCPL